MKQEYTGNNFYLLFLILCISLMNCSKKIHKIRLYQEEGCKSLDIGKYTYRDSLNYKIMHSKKWDFTIKYNETHNEYFFKNKKILKLSRNNTVLLINEFDERYLLISECEPNKHVPTPYHFKRNKIWIFDTVTSKLFYSNLNGIYSPSKSILLFSECSLHSSIADKHHIESPYGLAEINTSNLKLSLLDTTQKIIELDMFVVLIGVQGLN